MLVKCGSLKDEGVEATKDSFTLIYGEIRLIRSIIDLIW